MQHGKLQWVRKILASSNRRYSSSLVIRMFLVYLKEVQVGEPWVGSAVQHCPRGLDSWHFPSTVLSFSAIVLRFIASWMQDGRHGSVTREHAGRGQRETKEFLLVLLFCYGGKFSPEIPTDFPPHLTERQEGTEGLGVWDHTHALHLLPV